MEKIKLGIISDVFISAATRNKKKRRISGLNGLIIEFETNETINKDDVVEITINSDTKTFKVGEIEISEDRKLICRATEHGYWGDKISNKDKFDIRNLLDVEVRFIQDKDELKKIEKEACYC